MGVFVTVTILNPKVLAASLQRDLPQSPARRCILVG